MTGFQRRSFTAIIAALGLLLLALTPAAAQGGNPLGDFRGKADAFGGAADDDGMGDAAGSAAIHLGSGIFIQFDGLIGAGGGDTNWAVGGHIYWHDPKRGLVDVNLSFLDFDFRHVTRIGLHGQYYWGKITISGNIGYQIIGGFAADSVFGGASAAWYPVPNGMLQIGGDGYRRQGIGWVHAEYLLPLARWTGRRGPRLPGISIWVNGGGGNDNYWHVLAGIRIYFGGCAGTLITLHRTCGSRTLIRHWIAILRPGVKDQPGTRIGGGRAGGGAGGGGAVPSDLRLKTDIVRLATLEGGLGLYAWRYIWGGPVHVGVMAQEVALWQPDAVVEGPGGFLLVDYGKLRLGGWTGASDGFAP